MLRDPIPFPILEFSLPCRKSWKTPDPSYKDPTPSRYPNVSPPSLALSCKPTELPTRPPAPHFRHNLLLPSTKPIASSCSLTAQWGQKLTVAPPPTGHPPPTTHLVMWEMLLKTTVQGGCPDLSLLLDILPQGKASRILEPLI